MNELNNNSNNKSKKWNLSKRIKRILNRNSLENIIINRVYSNSNIFDEYEYEESMEEGIINYLPIEILRNVFKLVISHYKIEIPTHREFYNIITTCKSWNEIALSVLESIKLDRCSELPSLQCFNSMEKKIKSLKQLKIIGGKAMNYQYIGVLVKLIESPTTRLTHLNLFSNKIGDIGLASLSRSLHRNGSVVFLGLSYCDLSSASGESLHLLFKNNSTLQEIILSYNNLGIQGTIELAKGLPYSTSLTKLSLSHNEIGDQGAKEIGSALSQNKTITELDLRCNSIGSEGSNYICQYLLDNKSLVEIDLWGNSLGNDGANSIGKALTSNKYIKSINLTRNSIQEQGIKFITNALSLSLCSIVTIDLSSNSLTLEGTKEISRALSANRSIENINLSSNRINPNGCKILCKSLLKNTTIRSLNLSMNDIGEEGCIYLYRVLKKSKNLKELILCQNNIGNKGLINLLSNQFDYDTIEPTTILSELTYQPPTITTTIINNTPPTSTIITTTTIDSSITSATDNIENEFKFINSLNLSQNQITLTNEIIELVLGTLKNNLNITQLNLESNTILTNSTNQTTNLLKQLTNYSKLNNITIGYL